VRTCVRAVEQSKGRHSETKIAAAATELDIPVLGPITEHARYDLAFEIGGAILRVQCKWGALDNNGALIKVSLRSSWCTPSGYEHRQYKADEIDLVAVYCGELDRCYLLPHELAVGRRGIWLRLTPPKTLSELPLILRLSSSFTGL
jgi:PD-(D/E)XK endonuclease